MEIVEYGGWPNCIRLSNGEIELIATTAVGPRIIRLGFVGGQNMFHNYPDALGKTGGDEWINYGGHRLWHAPELFPRNCLPDNGPIEYSWDGRTLTLRNFEPSNGLAKEMQVTLSPDSPRVEVIHRIINQGRWTIELAVWALSVMAQGGRAIFPQEDFRPHPDALAPARPVVLWSYSDMSDPRWTWGRKYIQLRQDPKSTAAQKCGLLNTKGWAAYVLGGDVFIVRYPFVAGAPYADMGCNTESFTNPEMLEVETLAPLTRIEPGAHADLIESWLLAKANLDWPVDCGTSDAEIDAKILPLVG
jgi:hypothetical protein